MSKRVLVIDDDESIRDAVALSLRDLNCEVESVPDGAKGLLLVLEQEFDIVILDINLPGLNGFEVCRKMREQRSRTPIMILTSRSSEADIVRGLELGADDYLSKPFRMMEFLARVRSLIRRQEAREGQDFSSADPRVLVFGALTIDVDARTVTLGETRIELTALEFDVLLYLAKKAGRSISREQLMEDVWGEFKDDRNASINTVLSRVRRKLNSDGGEFITTVRGVGYRFEKMPLMKK